MVTYNSGNLLLKICNFFSVIYKKVILAGRIFNVGNDWFSKPIFSLVFNHKLTEFILS